MVGLTLLFIGSSTSWAASRNIRVGNLWDIYDDIGHEGWGGSVMIWPGGFWLQDLGQTSQKSGAAYKAFLVGTKDWQRPAADANWKAYGSALPDIPPNVGDPLPYYVVQRDTRGSRGEGFQLIRGTVQIFYKSNPATITTDGIANAALEVSEGQDVNLAADVKLVSRWRTNMGIEITRTVYAFIHPNHDDYHIWHYNFKNTGKYCCPTSLTTTGDPNATHTLQVPNLMFSHSIPWMDRDEHGQYEGACCEWAGDALHDYQGHSDAAPYARQDVVSDAKVKVGTLLGKDLVTGTNGVQNYGDLRLTYVYDGDAPNWPGTDFGSPHNITGRMMAARWPGLNLVHCDVSPTDRSDDSDQPRRSVYHNWGVMPEFQFPAPNGSMEVIYREMMWPGGKVVDNEKRFQRDAITLGQPYGIGAALQFIGPQSVFSFGGDNWDLDSGEETNVIEVSAVGGFDYQTTLTMGAAWIAGGGYTGAAETTRLKNYMTLEDSLFTIMRRAQDVIEPTGVTTSTIAELEARLRLFPELQNVPPGPVTFNAVSGPQKLDLRWTMPSGAVVDGFRLYRTTGSRLGDYPWVLIANQTTLTPSTTSYTDTYNVQVGIGYYYYLVSVKNGIESSMHAARLAKPVTPVTAPQPALVTDSVFVVPNPWDWRYQNFTFVGPALAGRALPGYANQVTFRGLVGECTIHIYTLDGVEIRRVSHAPTVPEPGVTVPSGTQAWDLKTDGGEPVVTGVYIYVVEGADGSTVVGKLVIIR